MSDSPSEGHLFDLRSKIVVEASFMENSCPGPWLVGRVIGLLARKLTLATFAVALAKDFSSKERLV